MDLRTVGDERQRRLLTRALPLGVVAVLAFVAGAVNGAGGSPDHDAARRYVEAWIRHDYKQMHAELSDASRRSITVKQMRKAYEKAAGTATSVSIAETGDPTDAGTDSIGEKVDVPLRVSTIAFGPVLAPLHLSFGKGGIAWTNNIVFPGLKRHEQLRRATRMPPRAAILARDGSVLAKGPGLARQHPLGSAAIDVTGEVAAPGPDQKSELQRLGYPPGEPVGVSGLELAFNKRLAGTPGGELRAVPSDGRGKGKILAKGKPQAGLPVKTTIDPNLQTTAVSALAGRSGGVAVLDARSGQVRALAGQAFSALQPPGSTFKIITSTAVLQKHVATLSTAFPVTDGANVGGRFISNAYNELCGGTLEESFAHSCNSVFAPLGAKVGGQFLTRTAERYGFNSKPTLYNAAATAVVDPPTPTMPTSYDGALDVGVSAIGQGTVQATPLLMASVAQTVANDGLRMPTPIVTDKLLAPSSKPVRVSSKKIADQVTRMMVDVVTSGTGIAGAIPEAQVAAKTGTAELGTEGEDGEPQEDAWFAAFAPAEKPKLAVGVMFIDAPGDGGTVAAPVAAKVLSAGL